jgi:4-oxalocrotonate tautomerase
MPLVNVHMASGRTAEEKRALMEAITAAVVDTVGAPIDSVRVWISEMADTDFMAAGEVLADKRARLASQAGTST